MRLDRNLNHDGKGKYAIINLRKVAGNPQSKAEMAAAVIVNPDCIEFGYVGEADEFWLIKLKDKHAFAALAAYADSAEADDPEYAAQVREMLGRSGVNSPFCKAPD